MTAIEFELDRKSFQKYCKVAGLQATYLEYRRCIYECGGVLNKHNTRRIAEWTVEFMNEEDAVAFRLKFGV